MHYVKNADNINAWFAKSVRALRDPLFVSFLNLLIELASFISVKIMPQILDTKYEILSAPWWTVFIKGNWTSGFTVRLYQVHVILFSTRLSGFYTIGASTASELFNYIVQVVSGCYIVKTSFAIFNTFQASFAFHIETSNFICTANQGTGFHIKCNTRVE